MARTKEEKYLVAFYEYAKSKGDPEGTFNRYEVGNTINFSPHLTKTITIGLMQANFFKKMGDDEIALSHHGIALVKELLGHGKR